MPFDQLPTGLQNALKGVQVEKAEWEALRKHAVSEAKLDGDMVRIMAPENIKNKEQFPDRGT